MHATCAVARRSSDAGFTSVSTYHFTHLSTYNCLKLCGFDYQSPSVLLSSVHSFEVCSRFQTNHRYAVYKLERRGQRHQRCISPHCVVFSPSNVATPVGAGVWPSAAAAASTMAIISHGAAWGRTDGWTSARAPGRADDQLVRHMEGECGTNSSARART